MKYAWTLAILLAAGTTQATADLLTPGSSGAPDLLSSISETTLLASNTGT